MGLQVKVKAGERSVIGLEGRTPKRDKKEKREKN
jgi:hypothetical protein